MYLKHENRTTRKEWWFQYVPHHGEFIDHGGVRYRVTSILHKTTPGGGNTVHVFCQRLQKQPGRAQNQWVS